READANEELRRVARAFEELPPRDRDALRLARVEGLSHREIADRLGVNEGASRMLLSRAAARLARLLARGS
ncbi:MAG: RNA polymerase sigma factor, partial [Planctomycetota bacterium JB042]